MSDTTPDRAGGETDLGGISDDQLPEDLRPTDDNPLAQEPADDDGSDSGLHLGPDGPTQS